MPVAKYAAEFMSAENITRLAKSATYSENLPKNSHYYHHHHQQHHHHHHHHHHEYTGHLFSAPTPTWMPEKLSICHVNANVVIGATSFPVYTYGIRYQIISLGLQKILLALAIIVAC